MVTDKIVMTTKNIQHFLVKEYKYICIYKYMNIVINKTENGRNTINTYL